MKRFVVMIAALLMSTATASAITVDGILDGSGYGSALAVQDTPTGFGDNINELNAAYAALDTSGNLSLLLTGNLENNGNGLVLFIDSRAGGAIAQTVGDGYGEIGSVGGAKTDDWGTDTDGGTGVSATPGGPSILDPDFNPDVSIEINAGGGGSTYYTNVIDMTLPNEPNDDRDIFIGQNDFGAAAVTQTYNRTDTDVSKGHGGTIEHAFDNTNTDGVFGFDFETPPGALGDPLSATTGYEALISSEFLANDGQPIRIMAFITNDGGDFLSNQFLGENGLDGETNLAGPGFEGGTPLFDAQLFAGNQFFVVPPPSGGLTGDHNGDGKVDAADYALWRSDPGSYGGAQGYTDWVDNFGTMLGSGAGLGAGSVPEPGSMLLLLLGGLTAFTLKRRG